MIYLFSLLALIFLLPILYFLPIGISKQGKFLIAGISFGLTLLGIAASNLYPIWAIGIMLMILLGLASYIIEQRYTGLLEVGAGPESDLYEGKYPVNEFRDSTDPVHIEKNPLESPDVKEDEEIISVEELENVMEKIESEKYKEDNLMGSNETQGTEEHNELLQDNDEALIENEMSDYTTESPQLHEDESEWFIENKNEIEEIEEIEEIKDEYEVEVFEEETVFDEEDLSEIENIVDETTEARDEKLEEIDVVLGEPEETASHNDEPLLERNVEEAVYAKDTIGLEDAMNEKVEAPWESPEMDSYNQEEEYGAGDLPKRNRIMREVMKTMIDQISLSRNLLTTDQMENMIKHYLHPSLHDQDYYTFSRILMDHYISTEQYKDLTMFIKEIEGRFKEYPYISMDIGQTKEFTLGKYEKLNR
jgi:hypothetical protein